MSYDEISYWYEDERLRMTKKHFGSSLEDWLESERFLEEIDLIVKERLKNVN